MVPIWLQMNLTVKNLPIRLHRKLKAQAQLNKRSLNGEVLEVLDRSLENKPVDVEALLEQVRRIHARLPLPPLTEELLREAKGEGRP
jgi:plasmid stability protein